MSKFTCKNCSVKFENAESQRNHYKTDWHHYNLKRKVADLPAVSAEEFKDRLLEVRNAEEIALQEQQTSLYCNACHRQFCSQNSLDNHLNSKKHKENMVKFKIFSNDTVTTKRLRMQSLMTTSTDEYDDLEDFEILDDESFDSDEWERIADVLLTERDCLFCTQTSEDLDANLRHMSEHHSFFIPDQDYCVDLIGLLLYLGEKITKHYNCIWCNSDRGFRSLDAVRKHMKDKGHCQMQYENLAYSEFANFYDYGQEISDTTMGVKIDDECADELRDENAFSLILPTGIVLGHRSLLRYYRQNIRPSKYLVLRKETKISHLGALQSRSLGTDFKQQKENKREKRSRYAMQRSEMICRMRRLYGGNDRRHRKRLLM